MIKQTFLNIVTFIRTQHMTNAYIYILERESVYRRRRGACSSGCRGGGVGYCDCEGRGMERVYGG